MHLFSPWQRPPVCLTLLFAMAGLRAPAQNTGTPAQTTSSVSAPSSPAAAATPTTTAGKSTGLHLFGKKPEPYTGPTEIVMLAPTPMLDEEGKQRLDPDGKAMFNAPVRQQRDRYGHPVFDGKGAPVFQTATDLGYDENGKKIHVDKVKPPRLTPVTVSRGTLVVDGMVAKAALNYAIADLQYIYLYAPGIGVAVVGGEPFPGATEQKNAFDGATLSVRTGGHTLELTSDVPLLGKQKEPKAAFVLLDRDFRLPTAAPVVGYGPVRKAPYVWPGSRQNKELAGVVAPPVPDNMLPTQVLSPCPSGQMRRTAPAALPGQPAPIQPCIPIPSGRIVKPPAAVAASTGSSL